MSEGNSLVPSGPLVGRLSRMARNLSEVVPGGDFVREQLRVAEDVALRTLRERLRDLDEDATPRNALPVAQKSAALPPSLPPLEELYAELLARSMNQSSESGREIIYRQLLAELVPDEARVLNAASDGHVIPVVHIEMGSLGRAPQRLLSNLSRIGTDAGVSALDMTSTYLTRLLARGLLNPTAEDRSQATRYDILENEGPVLRQMEEFQRQFRQKPRCVRSGVCISAAGKGLLQACGVLPPD